MLISDVHVSKDGVVLMFHDPGFVFNHECKRCGC